MKTNYSKNYSERRSQPCDLPRLRLFFIAIIIFSGNLQVFSGVSDLILLSEQTRVLNLLQQEFLVSGTVTDAATNEALIGVTIAVEGTSAGTITDVNGHFSLSVPSSESNLIVSYIGYVTQVIAINGQSVVNIAMQPDVLSLEEVVVVGYGVQKKATVTGAVASIGVDQLLQSPQANISNALVGRIPGLISVQPSGLPGDDQSILRIRGVGTFNGNADPLIMVDGIETDNYNNIDPNEIENISILKDASATAVYGVRGANGVLIITTKRGKTGKPQVSYSSQYASQRFTDIKKTMNAYNYAKSFNMAQAYDGYITGGYTPKFSDEAIEKYRTQEDPIFYPDVDWYPYMFDKSAGQIQHNLNISGGTDKVKYFISTGYFNQEGLIKHADLVKDFDAEPRYKRYNLRTNFDFEITKRFSASVNIASQIENRSGTAADIMRIFEATWSGNVLDHPAPEDVGGRFVYLPSPLTNQNPIQRFLSAGYMKDYRNYLNSSVRFDYDLDFITKGLSTHATLSYNNFNMQKITYDKNFVTYKARRLDNGSVVYIPQSDPTPFEFAEVFGKNRKIYMETGLDYARSFKNHNVTGLLLYNQSKRFDPELAYLVPNGYQGLVGRITYDYRGTYLAEANMGYNGTENFAPGKRFGFFPAYSLGWVMSNESFFPANQILSYFKIRGSYGVVGNDKIGGNRFLYRPASYDYIDNYYSFGEYGVNYQGYQGSVEGPLGNSDLTWERAKKMNLGAEINFFNNKLRITVDYFQEKRDNILANKNTVPVIVAAELPAYNLGKMSNSGYEGDFMFTQKFGELNVWLRGNFTYAHNVVEEMDETTKLYPYQQYTGQRFGQNFGLLSDGFFNTWEEVNNANRPVYGWDNNRIQPGDIKYVDVNRDGIINNDDMVPIGYSGFPEIVYGLSFGAYFKGFDLSVLFQGAEHVTVVNSRTYTTGFLEGANAPDYFVESWSQERYDQGLEINYPRLNRGYSGSYNNSRPSDVWITDASYLRLKNVEIGYTLPLKWMQKIGISQTRIYANGNNLYTWDKMFPGADPESAGNNSANYEPYPVTRTINFGINVKF